MNQISFLVKLVLQMVSMLKQLGLSFGQIGYFIVEIGFVLIAFSRQIFILFGQAVDLFRKVFDGQIVVLLHSGVLAAQCPVIFFKIQKLLVFLANFLYHSFVLLIERMHIGLISVICLFSFLKLRSSIRQLLVHEGVLLLKLAGIQIRLFEFGGLLRDLCLQFLDHRLIMPIFRLQRGFNVHQGHVLRFLNLEQLFHHLQVATHLSVFNGQLLILLYFLLIQLFAFLIGSSHFLDIALELIVQLFQEYFLAYQSFFLFTQLLIQLLNTISILLFLSQFGYQFLKASNFFLFLSQFPIQLFETINFSSQLIVVHKELVNLLILSFGCCHQTIHFFSDLLIFSQELVFLCCFFNNKVVNIFNNASHMSFLFLKGLIQISDYFKLLTFLLILNFEHSHILLHIVYLLADYVFLFGLGDNKGLESLIFLTQLFVFIIDVSTLLRHCQNIF